MIRELRSTPAEVPAPEPGLARGRVTGNLRSPKLQYCHIVNIRGKSYRMREHRALASRLVSAPTPEPASRPRERRPRREED